MAQTIVHKHLRKGKKVRQHERRYKRGLPHRPFRRVDIYNTIYKQDAKTGLMKGRKSIHGFGDRTGIMVDRQNNRIFGRAPKKKKMLFIR